MADRPPAAATVLEFEGVGFVVKGDPSSIWLTISDGRKAENPMTFFVGLQGEELTIDARCDWKVSLWAG